MNKLLPRFLALLLPRPLARLLAMLLAMLIALALPSCSEQLEEDATSSYDNWQARNEAAFLVCMDSARNAIAEAKALYGDSWEDSCQWRIYRSYALASSYEASTADSIVVRILNKGTGSGCPLYTDSVYVNYLGRLIPTDTYPEGEMFTYTGLSNNPEKIFSDEFSSPSLYSVGGVVTGLGTALLYMHIGDLWRVYIPYNLGYGSTENESVPAYSTLNFTIQLKAYYRKGTSPDSYYQ